MKLKENFLLELIVILTTTFSLGEFLTRTTSTKIGYWVKILIKLKNKEIKNSPEIPRKTLLNQTHHLLQVPEGNNKNKNKKT